MLLILFITYDDFYVNMKQYKRTTITSNAIQHINLTTLSCVYSGSSDIIITKLLEITHKCSPNFDWVITYIGFVSTLLP